MNRVTVFGGVHFPRALLLQHRLVTLVPKMSKINISMQFLSGTFWLLSIRMMADLASDLGNFYPDVGLGYGIMMPGSDFSATTLRQFFPELIYL